MTDGQRTETSPKTEEGISPHLELLLLSESIWKYFLDAYEEILQQEASGDLLETPEMQKLIGGTHASGWRVDALEALTWYRLDEESVAVEFRFLAFGEQDPDKPCCGDTVSGTAAAILTKGSPRIEYRDILGAVGHTGDGVAPGLEKKE